MGRLSDITVNRSLILAAQLMELADLILLECNDNSCLLFGAIIRDSAYRIKRAVEEYQNRPSLTG